jgi:hypothetical protein
MRNAGAVEDGLGEMHYLLFAERSVGRDSSCVEQAVRRVFMAGDYSLPGHRQGQGRRGDDAGHSIQFAPMQM